MKGKSIVMLAVALGCGLVAMIGVQQVLSGDKKEEAKKTMPVLVALEEISPGIEIEDSMVTFKEMPMDMMPTDAVTSADQYVNRGLRTRAFPGTPIVQAMLGEEGVFSASNEIPIGMRVAAISVTAKTAVAGFVNPHDRVDIQVTYKRRIDGKTLERTKTVLEYIEVFAVDKQRDMVDNESESIYKNISVLVTPEQVNLLRLAEKKGDLNFSLRHKDDDTQEQVADIDDEDFDAKMRALFGEDDIAPENADYVNPELSSEEQDIRNSINEEIVEEPVTEPIPTWTIVIYHDGEKTVEDVPLSDPNAIDNIDVEPTQPQGIEPEPSAT
ncbi:Flp pilus assembly protein CpaB [Symmachiella dynata]|uniref:Flp pilus assembly protein CpaB n=1 Tax=Symmachiella dynata TaxID=2527995 RepID=UPI0030EC7037